MEIRAIATVVVSVSVTSRRVTSIWIGTLAMTFAIITLTAPQFAGWEDLYAIVTFNNVFFKGFGKVVRGVLISVIQSQ